MRWCIKLFLFLMVCTAMLAGAESLVAADPDDFEGKRVPRYEPGKIRPFDPIIDQPYALHYESDNGPTTGVLDVCPEYEMQAGVIFVWGQGWNSKVTEMCVHAANKANNSKAYIDVATTTMMNNAKNALTNAGVDMDQVEFFFHTCNAIWCRDYGPHFTWHDDVRTVVDSHYYNSRPQDNAQPYSVAQSFIMQLYDMPMMYSGGNYQSTSNKHGYITDIVYNDNPGMQEAEVMALYHDYQGVDTLHIFEAFPFSIDGTGHIDMWMNILNDDTVIIGEYPDDNPTYPAYVITENAVTYMQSLGFTVYRVPNHNSGSGGYGGTHFTYTNGFHLNDQFYISYFGGSHAYNDSRAEGTFKAALPDHDIIPIYCADIIPYAGAIHCIIMQVPAYESPEPKAKVISPNEYEVWSGDRNIEWAADDDVEVRTIDIYVSLDGGLSFPYVIATGEEHDGVYEGYHCPWIKDKDCRIKIVAHDADSNEGIDESDTDFMVDRLKKKTYDFSTGAGVNKIGYGSYTGSWNGHLEGTRLPTTCNTPIDQIDPGAYTKISSSDNSRYPNPKGTNYQESTLILVFEIEEDLLQVASLEFLWEGYANACQHMEMYVWDYAEGNWGDGLGNYGNNEFMDNCSHTTDRFMKGAVDQDVKRYISDTGEVTLLIYNDKGGYVSHHDYVKMDVMYWAEKKPPMPQKGGKMKPASPTIEAR
ncbi:MAG: agmatine deiminase family protein [Planctomycetota bacterium]